MPLKQIFPPLLFYHHTWFIQAITLITNNFFQTSEGEETEEKGDEEEQQERERGEVDDSLSWDLKFEKLIFDMPKQGSLLRSIPSSLLPQQNRNGK